MEKFKVIAGCVTGANGKVYDGGTEVNAAQLGGLEMAKRLEEQDFVKMVKKETAKVEKPKHIQNNSKNRSK